MVESVDVRLRRLGAGDSDRVLAWRNLPEIRRWMYTDHVISKDEHDRWFASALVDERRCYWIVELDGQPVGLANLADITPARSGRPGPITSPTRRCVGAASGPMWSSSSWTTSSTPWA